MRMLKVHASEYAWVGSEVDVTIRNDGTTEELSDAVLGWLQLTETPVKHSYWYDIFTRPLPSLIDPTSDRSWFGPWF